MLSEKPNGSAPAATVNAHFVPAPGGGKLVLLTSEGKYVGTITFDAADAGFLGILGNFFQQFATQQSGGIQLAAANSVPGLRAS